MYILLLDGLLPKLVTCTSEAAFAGVPAMNATAIRHQAAVSTATPAASSGRNHLFIFGPLSSKYFGRRQCFKASEMFLDVCYTIPLLERFAYKMAKSGFC